MAKICNNPGSAWRSRSKSEPIDNGLRAAATKRSRLFSARSGSLAAGKCSANWSARMANRSSVRPTVAMFTRLACARLTSTIPRTGTKTRLSPHRRGSFAIGRSACC